MLTRWMWAAVSLCFFYQHQAETLRGETRHRSSPSRCFCPPAVAAQGSSNRSARGDPSLGDETLVYHQKQDWGMGGSITVFGVGILGQLEEASDSPEILHMRS